MPSLARQPTTLEIVLAAEFLTIVRWIESLPDDELDPDTGVKILEDLASVVGELGPEDQETFIRAARDLVEERPEDWNASAIEGMLAGLNLVESAGRQADSYPEIPPAPPLPPDLDDRVASINSAFERYMNRKPGEPPTAGDSNPRDQDLMQRVRRRFRRNETPDA